MLPTIGSSKRSGNYIEAVVRQGMVRQEATVQTKLALKYFISNQNVSVKFALQFHSITSYVIILKQYFPYDKRY